MANCKLDSIMFNDSSPNQDVVLPTIVSRVTWGDVRFVDFEDFIKNFILNFVFIH